MSANLACIHSPGRPAAHLSSWLRDSHATRGSTAVRTSRAVAQEERAEARLEPVRMRVTSGIRALTYRGLPTRTRGLRRKHLELPRRYYLFEDHRVRPAAALPAEMSSVRIDPRVLGHIAVVEQQMHVGNRDLGILNAGDHQHRFRRLAKKALGSQRQRLHDFLQFRHAGYSFQNTKTGRQLIRSIFPVSHHRCSDLLTDEKVRNPRRFAHNPPSTH